MAGVVDILRIHTSSLNERGICRNNRIPHALESGMPGWL